MGWHGHLELRYRRDSGRTVVLDRHDGPLRVLASLHPEGPDVCHNVLVHPPGGIVGGDRLDILADLQPGTHALITTPGATRFYRSAGQPALQSLVARVAEGACLEWLPLETIAYSGTLSTNRMRFELAPGARMIGWDLLALGLPASGEPFTAGRFEQQLELPGVWLERGVLDAADPATQRLLASPLGFDGRHVLGTMWLAAGEGLPADLRSQVLETARDALAASPLAASAGATATHDPVVVVRALAARTEPLMQLFCAIWAAWRPWALARPACPPRVWRT